MPNALSQWEWELLQPSHCCDLCSDDGYALYLSEFNATHHNTTETREVNDMPHPITYGVEMECYVPRSIGQAGVANALQRLGVDAVVAGYGGRDYTRWQVKTDCSLNQPPNGYTGIEIVSPILNWDGGGSHPELQKVSEYLVGIEARVNETCGGHVHLSVDHLTTHGIANLVDSYYDSRQAIGSFLSRSRRNGTYYASYHHDIHSVTQNIRLNGMNWVGRIGGHTSVINADWYSQRGTFEFRQRQGSVNHYRITAWVGLLVGLIRAAERGDDALALTDPDELTAHMIEGDLLSEVFALHVANRSVPRITSAVIEELAEARATAQARVSRLLTLQGVR